MSQLYKSQSATPEPPQVLTSVTTDVHDNTTAGPGTAIPAANNLQFLGRDTTQNDVYGIRTDANPNNGSVVQFELTNRAHLTSSTVGAANDVQTIFTPTAATSLTFTMTLTAFDSANNLALGGEQIGLIRVSGGGAVTVIGTNDTFDEYDAALGANDWEVTTNGTVVQLSVTGVAGHNLNWSAVFTYIQVS